MHLKQSGFTYKACGLFTRHCERIQKFKETCNLKHLYKNELDKACFAQVAYSDSEDLAKRTISDKILKDRAYEISRNRNYDECQRVLAIMVYKFFDKKKGSGVGLNEKLHKLVIKKFKRRKVYVRFKDNIRVADLAAMESLPTRNKI